MDKNEYYDHHYEKIINSGFTGKIASLYHHQIERKFKNKFYESIIELGSGNGQHFKYLRCDFREYFETDIRSNKEISFDRKRIKVYADAENLAEFSNNQFDRVISTCLLPHLTDPLTALAEWRRITKTGGTISIYIPCEPSLLLRFAQSITTKRKVKKLGINYQIDHYLEHRNHYFFLQACILTVFKSDKIKKLGFPFGVLPFDLKLYEIYQIDIVK